jgi:hypothetical protein
MRIPILTLVWLAIVTGYASADPNVLEGGALITHYDPLYSWTGAPCDDYYMHPLTTCDDQVNRIDTPTYVEVTWYVIADYGEEKIWCGCQFGFGPYDPAIMYFADWMPCFPPDGGLEIDSPGWPGPDEGTAIVVTGAPWEGDMVPQYAFNGYAYGYGGAGIVQLIPDPSVAIPFGGFGNCASPPEKWDALRGGMGVNMDGIWVCGGGGSSVPGVCCIGEECVIVYDPYACEQLGGEYHPEWEHCGPPNPCEVLAVCCLEGECIITSQEVCEAIGGTWYPAWPDCGPPNPCPPWGACCFDCDCVLIYEEECLAQGGIFVSGPCDPNPCPGSPAEARSWGSIKTLFR